MTQQEAIDALWESIPPETTWEDLAKGIVLQLPKGKRLNTAADDGKYLIRSMENYIERLERRAVFLLCDSEAQKEG